MTNTTKQSGIDWIGEIPSDWSLKKIRFATTVRTEVGKYTPDDVFIGLENVESSSGRLIQTESEYEEGIYDVFRKGDVLFSKLRPYLEKAFIADFDGFCTGEFVIFKGFDGDKRFLFYFLLSHGFIEIVNSSTYGAKMPRASWDYIKNLQLPLPCATEQRSIIAFLDDRCGYVDGIIADLEMQLEVLRQYKKALITETVTKGLDKSAPMKDSGIDWIGEMPRHWELKRVKHSTSVIGSGTTPESGNTDFYDGDIPWIQSGDLYGRDVIIETEKTITPLAVKSCSALRLYQNDFVIVAMYGASVGNVAISKISGYVNQACCVMLPNGSNDVRYLYYWLATCKDDLVRQSFGGGQPNISQQKIKNEPYLQAPLLEQQRIADFLDAKCAEMDALIAEKQYSVETMRQYKRSLIYEYVTGKKRVVS